MCKIVETVTNVHNSDRKLTELCSYITVFGGACMFHRTDVVVKVFE